MIYRKALFAAAALLMQTSCAPQGLAPVSLAGNDVAEDWPNTGGGTDESGYSRLKSIDRGSVANLGLAWSLDLPGEVSLEATPLAVDGTLYFTGSYSAVYAVNGTTGALLWRHEPEIWKHSPDKSHFAFPVNRGAAYAQGRIFSATLDGRLLALDAATGRLLWSVQTVDPKNLQTSTGAPRVFKDKVIIGNGGADLGARGYVTAYDQATGKQAWRFYTAPGSPEDNRGDPALERAAKTWGDTPYWRNGTGGTAWNGMTFDPELNRIYIGTGNSGPYDPAVRDPRGGDNLYLASIVALDADTGKYIWHYQVNPREAWDYKATMNMIAATATIDGHPRKVLMQAPTNGFFYVLDRETGKLISAEKIGKVTWAERIDTNTGRPVEAKGIRFENGETTIFPSMAGAHSWQAMSYSPSTGLVYIPYMQLGVRYNKSAGRPGFPAFELVKTEPEDGKGALIAWDPIAQKQVWKVQHDLLWNGGTLATAGDLVFQGTADGFFSAFDARTGARLWRFDAGLGIISAPMSWSVGGKQYVSVLVGYGGTTAALSEVMNVGWKYGEQPRRLLTFAIGGKATLPPSPPRDMAVHAVDDPELKLDERDVSAGKMFYAYCGACHGPNLQSAGAPAPDLRESGVALSEDSLWSVLNEGALEERGMPRFAMLSRKQVHQIHAYIRAGAREELGLRKPAEKKSGASGF